MSCPTCGFPKMNLADQYQETIYLWCPQCGTRATRVGDKITSRAVPRLVVICRLFEESSEFDLSPESVGDKWESLGIKKSIRRPEESHA